MKKRLSRLLAKWALRLNPEAAVEAAVPVYENYEAKAIGLAQEITKSDLRKFKQQKGEKSGRRALRQLVDKTVKEQASRILNTARGFVEVSVYKRGDCTVVESRLNVYIREADAEDIAAEG